ncbi:hypothetical protein [Actinosynnema sp. NPDC023587]|uniref:hypothetical protein n=1 Tax=Actinosynnema sp. NPDC023587 TaxID=3154695 RepID=UPI0033DB78C9
MTKDELLFNAWLTNVNTRLGRYIVRLVDENSHAVPPDQERKYSVESTQVEVALADDLGQLARAIELKATGQPFPVSGE